jgi:hypothetical protein
LQAFQSRPWEERVSTRLRIFAALVSVGIAVACILESARHDVPAEPSVRVAAP